MEVKNTVSLLYKLETEYDSLNDSDKEEEH